MCIREQQEVIMSVPLGLQRSRVNRTMVDVGGEQSAEASDWELLMQLFPLLLFCRVLACSNNWSWP